MDGEAFPEIFDEFRVSQAVDIDPGHGFGVPERETFGDLVDLFLLEVGGIIVDDGDTDREIASFTVDTE